MWAQRDVRAWMRPMAVVSKTRSRYSAWWKACLVEKAQARRVGSWLKAGGGRGWTPAGRAAAAWWGARAATVAARPPSLGRGGQGRSGPLRAAHGAGHSELNAVVRQAKPHGATVPSSATWNASNHAHPTTKPSICTGTGGGK